MERVTAMLAKIVVRKARQKAAAVAKAQDATD